LCISAATSAVARVAGDGAGYAEAELLGGDFDEVILELLKAVCRVVKLKRDGYCVLIAKRGRIKHFRGLGLR
jgi:hypothetical protein